MGTGGTREDVTGRDPERKASLRGILMRSDRSGMREKKKGL